MKTAHLAPQAEQADDGDAARSLEEAFARLQPELLGMLYYLVGNIEDARDALQETFIKCWRNHHQVGEIENLKAWIFRIALNTGRDMRSTVWQRRRKPLAGDGRMLATNAPTAHTQLERQEQLAQVQQALLDLRPEEQEVFLLRQNGYLKYDEIARTIGIPLNTAKTRMRLALSKLRKAVVPRQL